MASFREQVYALVVQVPVGKVTSYGRLAAALGHPRKAREVGWALSSTPPGLTLNAHRVVGHDGHLSGGWAFGAPEAQRALLEAEGVRFTAALQVDLGRHLWAQAELGAAAQRVLDRAP